MKSSNLSKLMLWVVCLILPQMISAFWVAPMWGNKVEGEAYGQQNSGGSSTIAAHRGANTLNSQVYGNMAGETGSAYGKYPGWVSRKQGMPISGSFGKRYGKQTVWSLLFDCSIDASRCQRGFRRQNEATY